MGQFENPYLYYLINPNTGEYYYKDNTGTTSLTATETPLTDSIYVTNDPQAPDGWRDLEAEWVRSTLYTGLTRNITTQLKFQKDAADILNDIYLSNGLNAECRLVIKKYDYANTGSAVTLNTFYTGDLDFNKIDPSATGVSIGVVEAGLRNIFTKKENIVYEIPIDSDPDVVVTTIDGVMLKGTFNFIGADLAQNFNDLTLPFNIFPGLAFVNSEGDYVIGKTQDITPHTQSTGANPSTYFFKSSLTQTLTIIVTGTIRLSWMPTDIGSVPILDPADLVVGVDAYDTELGGTYLGGFSVITATQEYGDGQITYTFATSGTINVAPGNCLYFVTTAAYAGAGYNNNPLGVETEPNLQIIIHSEFQLPASNVNALREVTVLERLTEAMTGGAYTADTTFLSGVVDRYHTKPYNTVYTTGDAIRGLPGTLKITPRDFFDNVMRDYGAGVCIENNQIVIRPKSEIFDSAVELMSIGEVTKLSPPPALDYSFNYIEVGNAEQTYDTLNGRDEFMNTSKFENVLPWPEALNLVRPFRYDPYGIEAIRYKMFHTTTTDNEADNNVFVYEIDPGSVSMGGYLPRRDQNNVGCFASGILYPETKYNISKAPLMVFMRNFDFIQGMLFFRDADNIVFRSTEKNSTLSYRLDPAADEYAENGTINTFVIKPDPTASGTPYAPLFAPLLLQATGRLPADTIDTLNATSNGYISFTYKGKAFRGFPLRVKMKPVTGAAQEMTLLCHPDVNLTDLKEVLRNGQ